MPQIARGWHIGVSVESPDTDTMAATDSLSRKLSTWLPDFDALVQYEWARGQHVRLAGMVRSLGYRNLVEQKNHYAAGWGVQLSSVTHPAAPFTTYQTLCYGRGIADMTGDMQMGSYDMVPDPAVPGAMYVPRILGWSLGLQYNIRPELFVSVSTSMMRYYPRGKVAPDEYKYGQFACANVFWSPTPRSQVGLEYDWGRRRNFSGDERCAHRIGAFCQFSF